MSRLTYRPATLDDAALAADVMTAAYPDLAEDPVITRYHWEHPRQSHSYGRFIAEMDSRPIAFLDWSHGPWENLPDRNCQVDVLIDRAALSPDLAGAMYAWISAQAEADGAGLLVAYVAEDEPDRLAALASQGFERDRLEKLWELDLRESGLRLVADAKKARDTAAGAGIHLTTFATWRHPKKIELLHQLYAGTRQDIPHTVPILAETMGDFLRRVDAPGIHHDRWWIAIEGDRPVSLSYLFFPPVRGPVSTGYTCTHADYRGRGLARAIKLQSLAQAFELGLASVIADNDSENAAMLHINESLGYQLRPGFVGHLKRVSRS
jgi:RimJ/RimL family protein N-acetyltransferase